MSQSCWQRGVGLICHASFREGRLRPKRQAPSRRGPDRQGNPRRLPRLEVHGHARLVAGHRRQCPAFPNRPPRHAAVPPALRLGDKRKRAHGRVRGRLVLTAKSSGPVYAFASPTRSHDHRPCTVCLSCRTREFATPFLQRYAPRLNSPVHLTGPYVRVVRQPTCECSALFRKTIC